MRYYLDTEFDGMGGELISMALVRQDCTLEHVTRDRSAEPIIERRRSLYLVTKPWARDPWVKEHVIPILDDVPAAVSGRNGVVALTLATDVPHALAGFLLDDAAPEIIADWPDDIARFCNALITGPGRMIATPQRLQFAVVRVDAYPTSLPGAVQHNAWWDAMALRRLCEGPE